MATENIRNMPISHLRLNMDIEHEVHEKFRQQGIHTIGALDKKTDAEITLLLTDICQALDVRSALSHLGLGLIAPR